MEFIMMKFVIMERGDVITRYNKKGFWLYNYQQDWSQRFPLIIRRRELCFMKPLNKAMERIWI